MGTIRKINVNGQEYDLAGYGGSTMISVTYQEIVSLIQASSLVAGNKYRITDYVTKVNDKYKAVSAEKPFDIIVTAKSSNKLERKASAIMREGDDYFAGSDLGSWEIWYDINNDTKSYPIAHESGKGYIYRLIDEYGNEADFDFKNIKWKIDSNIFKKVTNGPVPFFTFTFLNSYNGISEDSVMDASLDGKAMNNEIYILDSITNTAVYVLSVAKPSIGSARIKKNSSNKSFFIAVKGTVNSKIDTNDMRYGLNIDDVAMEVSGNTVNNYVDILLNGANLMVTNNLFNIEGQARLQISGSLKGCTVLGSFKAGSDYVFQISESCQGKIIVSNGDGESFKIIDPFTLQ